MSEWPELVVSVATLRQRDNLRDLKRGAVEDASVEIDTTVVAKGLAITTSRIPDGESVNVRATITADHQGVAARGSISSAWEGECRRCLELVREEFTADLDVTFLLANDFETHEMSVDDADAYEFDGVTVDLGEVVREELMLALPLSPLCREGCDGVESEHFVSGDADDLEDADEGEPAIDPRWAALSELTFDED